MSSGIYIQNIQTHRTKKKIKSILTPRISKRKVAQYLVFYFVNKMIFHCGQSFPKNRLKLLHVARLFWFARSRHNCASMFFQSIKLRSNNELLGLASHAISCRCRNIRCFTIIYLGLELQLIPNHIKSLACC